MCNKMLRKLGNTYFSPHDTNTFILEDNYNVRFLEITYFLYKIDAD